MTSLVVSGTEFRARVAQAFFQVSWDSAIGALLTLVVVIITHWSAQPGSQLLAWVLGVSIPLALRAASARLYLSADAPARARWYPVLYGLQWVGFVGTAVLWVLSLSMLGSGQTDTLFHVRAIFVIAVLSFYLSVIGMDRWLYTGFAVVIAVGFWLDLVVYYPSYLEDLPSTPIALALYCAMLLARSRQEQARCHDAIRAHMTQDMLLDELQVQATQDALTGTSNRGWIEKELRRLIKLEDRRAGDFSVLLLDVDLFKQINDRHGHDAGDAVLRRLATQASTALRDTDMLGRWGGEEFMALLPDTSLAAAMEVGERLRKAIAQSPFLDATGQVFGVTVSIGVAQHQRGENGDIVSKHADIALYAAKHAGRNCCRQFDAQALQSAALQPDGHGALPG